MTAKLIKKIFAPMPVLILVLSILAPFFLVNNAFAAELGETEYIGEYEESEYSEEDAVSVLPCVYDQLFAAKTVEEFFVIMCQTEENKPEVFGFNPEQLAALKAYAETLPCTDTSVKADLAETFELLASGELGDVATYANTTYSSNQTWKTQTINNKIVISGTVTITVTAGSTVTLMGEVRVPQNASLTIKCAGSATLIRGDADQANGNDMFDVDGSLRIYTTNGGKITVDGNNALTYNYDNTAFRIGNNGVKGTVLDLENVIIRDWVNLQPNGAAIRTRGNAYYNDYNCYSIITLSDCEITNCIGRNGPALRLNSDTCCDVTLERTIISDCVAWGDDYVSPKNTGGTGGIIRTGGTTGARLVMRQCILKDNWSGYESAGDVRIFSEEGGTCYGAGIYWNANGMDPYGEMSEAIVYDCQFISNHANNSGGAIFNESHMTIGTEYEDGFTPYETSIGSIRGTLFLNNEAGGYLDANGDPRISTGGAVSVPSYKGGAKAGMDENVTMSFTEGVYFIGNEADQGGGFGMYITYTEDKTDGTGFFVDIDGAVFENNIASKYGGAIFLAMTHSGYEADLSLLGGSISGNSAPDGGAVYVSNVNVSIGTSDQGPKLFSNSATDGGAIYLNNTPFKTHGEKELDPWQTVVINNGEIYDNTAADDGTTDSKYGIGGAVYVKGGSATINGGDIHDNTATFGGAISVDGGNITMNGGKIYSCTASQYGGGALVSDGRFTLNAGEIYSCQAYSGGALSVSSNDPNGDHLGLFEMFGGTIYQNTADNDGGAVYVYLGRVQMKDGTFSENAAARYGGAVCVQVGEMEIFHGLLEKNVAEYGGAVCVDRGDFYMYSGIIQNNGWDIETRAIAHTVNGGGAYIRSGNAYIGMINCTIDSPVDEHLNGKYTHHPIIRNNAAEFGGGIASHGDVNDANIGNLYLYCSEIDSNYTGDDGKGRNAFADGGNVEHYVKGTVIGDYREEDGVSNVYDPGIVVIGGNVHAPDDKDKAEIKIIYHSGTYDSEGNEIVWDAIVVQGFIMNLPYCPDEWNVDEHTFVGWTSVQDIGATQVRYTDDYRWIGERFEVKIPEDGQPINLYALWAPDVNNIDYNISLDGTLHSATDAFENNFDLPKTYELKNSSDRIILTVPYKYGYTFVEWRFYAVAETASNWGKDPADPDQNGYVSFTVDDLHLIDGEKGVYALDTLMNFGDLMMVAVFEQNETVITYHIVGVGEENKGGSVNVSSEYIGAVSGVPGGSNAIIADGYKIIGWYADPECKIPVDLAWITNDDICAGYTAGSLIIPALADGQMWEDPSSDTALDPDPIPYLLPIDYYVKIEYVLEANDSVEAGEQYDGFDGTDKTVTVLKDRYFTVQYDFALPYSDVSFVSDKAFPAGTKLILIDLTDEHAWTAYSCVLESATYSVSIADFTAMDGDTHPSADALSFVLCVDLSKANADIGEYGIRLDDNNTDYTVGYVTVNLRDFANVGVTAEGGEDGFTATVTVDGIATTDSGNTMHSLVIELLDESGKALDYPAGSIVSIAGKDVKVHDNRAMIDGITDGTYDILIDLLPAGTYKLNAYLSQETAQKHSVQERASVGTAEAIVTSSKETVYAITDDNRFIIAGVGGTLEFETDASEILLQTKRDGVYVDGASGISVSDKTVTVSAQAASGTYRIVFKKGTAVFNYNIIVYND